MCGAAAGSGSSARRSGLSIPGVERLSPFESISFTLARHRGVELPLRMEDSREARPGLAGAARNREGKWKRGDAEVGRAR
jgi:hypothetical protein